MSSAATDTAVKIIDFAIVTIFAREVLEGAIIIGQYRTIILRGDSLKAGISKDRALREVTLSSLFATAFALLVIAAIAIPLALLSQSFDPSTAKIIEGVSKIVAAISLLQLSLKLPKWLGVYGSVKKKTPVLNCLEKIFSMKKTKTKKDEVSKGGELGEEPRAVSSETDEVLDIEEEGQADSSSSHLPDEEEEHVHEHDDDDGMTLHSIRFNVAWNIWREVAECGVFLIPFFLSGENLTAIPLSAIVGAVVGLLCGVGIYFANKRFKKRIGLAVFASLLLVVLSAGLFTGGCHNLEKVIGSTPQVWVLDGDFWSVDRLPMTIIKPFGYNDSRSVLEIVCYWSWLILAALLHLRKYLISPKIVITDDDGGGDGGGENDAAEEQQDGPSQDIIRIAGSGAGEEGISDVDDSDKPILMKDYGDDFDTVEMGDSSLEGDIRSKAESSSQGAGSGPQTYRQVSEASLEVSLGGGIQTASRSCSSISSSVASGDRGDDGDGESCSESGSESGSGPNNLPEDDDIIDC